MTDYSKHVSTLLVENAQFKKRIAELEAREYQLLTDEETMTTWNKTKSYNICVLSEALQRKFAEVNGLKVKS